MIRQGRIAATLQDGFVVFLIGMRINRVGGRTSASDRLKGTSA